MKYIKIIIFLFVICSFKLNIFAYNIKEGEVYIGYDSYKDIITPNQLISSATNYYIDTNIEEVSVYKYLNNSWFIYDDTLKAFISNKTLDIEKLEFNRIIGNINKYLNNLTETKLKENNSFIHNEKYYFLINDLKKQGIKFNAIIDGYIVYKDKKIIGYDITFNNESFRKTENSDVINVRDYGAIGNGISDDTYSIQNAVDKLNEVGGILYFPNGNYIMEVKTGWQPKQHDESLINIKTDKKVILEFDGSTIKMQDGRAEKDNLLSHYNIIKLESSSEVVIQNGNLIGDRVEHCYYQKSVNNNNDCEYKVVENYYYPTHEFGFGIHIGNKSKNIKLLINKMNIRDLTGDAIVIDSFTSDVTIQDTELYKTRRQGISVLNVDKLLIKDTKIHDIGHSDNINGTWPMSGIDLEPNHYNNNCDKTQLNNIIFENVDIRETSSFGIVNGGCYTEDIKDFEINNSYIEGIVLSKVNIKNSIINNKMSLTPDNTNSLCTKKYLSISNSKVLNSEINMYNNEEIGNGSMTFGILNSEIDNSKIFVNSDTRLSLNLRNTKLTNSHLKNGSFRMNDKNAGNDMILKEGSGNNIYENFYFDMKGDFFNETDTVINNSIIQTHSNVNFNNITFKDTILRHTWVNSNSVKFINCNFNNVDVSRFYAKDLGTYYLNGNGLSKICTFNYKDNNNCIDY